MDESNKDLTGEVTKENPKPKRGFWDRGRIISLIAIVLVVAVGLIVYYANPSLHAAGLPVAGSNGIVTPSGDIANPDVWSNKQWGDFMTCIGTQGYDYGVTQTVYNRWWQTSTTTVKPSLWSTCAGSVVANSPYAGSYTFNDTFYGANGAADFPIKISSTGFVTGGDTGAPLNVAGYINPDGQISLTMTSPYTGVATYIGSVVDVTTLSSVQLVGINGSVQNTLGAIAYNPQGKLVKGNYAGTLVLETGKDALTSSATRSELIGLIKN